MKHFTNEIAKLPDSWRIGGELYKRHCKPGSSWGIRWAICKGMQLAVVCVAKRPGLQRNSYHKTYKIGLFQSKKQKDGNFIVAHRVTFRHLLMNTFTAETQEIPQPITVPVLKFDRCNTSLVKEESTFLRGNYYILLCKDHTMLLFQGRILLWPGDWMVTQ